MSQQKQSPTQEQLSFYRPKPDGDIDPTGEAGWYLQRERERRNISLDEAGELCGIHPHHLEGIELGDLTRLPPRTEALRMIGVYAQFLEFDPQPLILHYTQFLPQPVPIAKHSKPRRPHPLSSAKIIKFASFDKLKQHSSGAGGVVASVLAAIIVFQGMVFVLGPEDTKTGAQQSAVEQTTETGSNAQSTGDEQIVSSISQISEEQLDDTAVAPASPLNAATEPPAGGLSGLTELIEQDVVTLKVPKPKLRPVKLGQSAEGQTEPAVQQVRQTAAAPGTTSKVHGAENANSRLVLKATGPVWVRIEDRQGNVVMTQTFNKGDIYKVPAREGLVIIARDGGLLTYSIDGVEKGQLGPAGEILTDLSLDLPALSSSRG